MQIENIKKIAILGWGKTGIALTNLVLSLKKKVYISEKRERKEFPSFIIDKFKDKEVEFEFGGHSEKFLKHAQLIILSPGINLKDASITRIIQNLNLPYLGEIEFCYWLTKAKFIAITGTNGKTTTTFLAYRVLKEKRKRVFLGGNIGIPLSCFVLKTKPKDLIVLEISSFQLETIIKFRPFVATLLNLEQDHLDRHSDFRQYLEAKLNIFKNQREVDYAVLNRNINFLKELEKTIKAKKIYFSSSYNENLSCVYKIASIFGVPRLICEKIFSQFKGLPHRLELVKEIKGIKFINDSKATNPHSTIWALKNIKQPLILIAGGKDKGVDFSAIIPYLKKVKKINLIGESAHKLKKIFSPYVYTEIFYSLKEAVINSFKEASKNDVVLFSPMCASFDMFSNYRERGEEFKKTVRSLC
jgi:UDP-N-acetylmuramoylalanine--D-glutamate ligase